MPSSYSHDQESRLQFQASKRKSRWDLTPIAGTPTPTAGAMTPSGMTPAGMTPGGATPGGATPGGMTPGRIIIVQENFKNNYIKNM